MTTKPPLWHLVMLVIILLALSAAGGLANDWQPDRHGRHAVLLIYGAVMLLELVMVLFVLWQWPWRPTNRWRNWRTMLGDIAVAIALGLIFTGVSECAVALLGPNGWGAPSGLLPKGPIEIAGFALLSIVAGFALLSIVAGVSEEIIYRGYLLQRLGILGQAVLFGASHGYQSAKSMALIMVWGVLYGLVVRWRKSLAPGMLAHACLDIVGVILVGL